MDLYKNHQLGQMAEHLAARFLKKNGLNLLYRNYYNYHGEIDLIMQDQTDIVFVEVRYRSRSDYGSALESITRSKIKKLIKTATRFLQEKNWLHTRSSRFDVIGLQWVNKKIEIEWIKNSFN